MEKERHEALSEREYQIAQLASEGLTDKEIARRINVSVTTIRTYWMRIRRKVRASNRAQAIVRALDSRSSGPVAASVTASLQEHLLEGDTLGVVAIDKDGELVAANNAFLNMVGHDRETLEKEGLKWDDLVLDDPRHRDEGGDPNDIPPQAGILKHRDGHPVRVVTAGTSIEEPGGIDVSCVVDIGDKDLPAPSQS